MKKMLSVILLIACLFTMLCSSFYAYSRTQYGYSLSDTDVINTPDGLYLLCYSGASLTVQQLSPVVDSAQLSLSESIYSASVFNRRVVVLCRDYANRQLVVYVYNMDTGILDSFAINGATEAHRNFYYDGDLYLVSGSGFRVVSHYNSSGILVQNYTFSATVSSVFGDGSGGVYAVSANGLYQLSGDRFTLLSGSVYAPVRFIGGGYIIDASGCVSSVSGGSVKQILRVSDPYAVCADANMLYYADGASIYGYQISRGKNTVIFNSDYPVIALSLHGNKISAIVNSGTLTALSIGTDEFSAIKEASLPSSYGDQSSSSGSGSYGIYSAVYHVDNERYVITGISPGTGLAEFKANMNFDGYNIRFYRSGNRKTSGTIGTAMTVVFENETESITYEAGVTGDLTGEGSCNSRDINMMMKYILGEVRFSGVYLDAADISSDQQIDVLDLALLNQMQ